MKCDLSKYLFFSVALIVFTIFPALLLYFLAYQPSNNFNKSAIETECLIIDQLIYQSTSKSSSCYNGVLHVVYINEYNVTENDFIEVTPCQSYVKVIEELSKEYRINGTVTCFYTDDNIRVELYQHTNVFLGISISLICLFFVCIIMYTFCKILCKHIESNDKVEPHWK